MDCAGMKFAVFGGDERQSCLFRILEQRGLQVDSFGVPGGEDKKSWKTVLESADCLLFPLPMTQDGVRLFQKNRDASESIRLDSLAKCGKKIVFGGKIPERFRAVAEANGARVFDYFDSEPLQVLNALPSAEGAIFTAMQALPVTIFGSAFAVVGYGRIGRLLSERLTALGAKVTVYERKIEKHAFIRFSGAIPKALFDEAGNSLLGSIPTECRAIFNTVPEPIFRREILEKLPMDCLFIDLASPPGGLDQNAAAELGINRIWATALPGKYAPESAASYLAETILSVLA